MTASATESAANRYEKGEIASDRKTAQIFAAQDAILKLCEKSDIA
jgi:hypothetical protein